MSILDYKKVYDKSIGLVVDNANVSEINKECYLKYLESKEVGYARKNIINNHIVFLLERTPDIKTDMFDRDKINSIFKDIRDKTKLGYYETIKAVAISFVKWLNDDEKPKGFKDIKNSKKGQKRHLTPKDMITWEDATEMCKYTDSIQIKALLMTQLDGGFRPSELHGLNYGDIEVRPPVMVINVLQEKTNQPKEVLNTKSFPYLKQWLDIHPHKTDDSPLWILEYPNHSRNKAKNLRFGYRALANQIKKLGELAKINKPMDLYNWRHSACTIAKKENMPIELACKKFGHNPEYFIKTYGRLTKDEDIERMKNHYKAIEEVTQEKVLPNECIICHHINPPKAEFCHNCTNPLTLRKALENRKELASVRAENQNLKEKVEKLERFASAFEMMFNDPEKRKILDKMIK